MASNGGLTGCWRRTDAAFHRPFMDSENTRPPARTPDKPGRRIPDKHVVSRIHQAQRPRRALSRNAGAVSPVNY